MCYRTSLVFTPTALTEELSFPWEDQRGWEQLAHVSGFMFPSLPFVASDRPTLVSWADWGLVPSWAKADKHDDFRKNCLNARSETAHEKASFKSLIYRRRGLLPVSGFIEWHHASAKDKQPYHVRSTASSIMTLGCLWDEWVDKVSGETQRTFSILTTEANELMQFVHNSKKRQPVIIPEEHRASWLSPRTPSEVSELMLPVSSSMLEAIPIAKGVHNVGVSTDLDSLAAIDEPLRL